MQKEVAHFFLRSCRKLEIISRKRLHSFLENWLDNKQDYGLQCRTITRDFKEQGLPIIGFSVTEEEQTRLLRIVARIRARNTSVDLSKVVRELIGLDPLTLVTPEDFATLQIVKPTAAATTHTGSRPPGETAESANPYEITKKLLAEGYEIDFQTVAEVLILDAPGVAPEIRELILFEAGRLPKHIEPTADQQGKTPESKNK